MNNNDILIRLRYALDFSNQQMVEIFRLGGKEIDLPTLGQLLTKQDPEADLPRDAVCDSRTLEQFFNGLIVFKRGPQPAKPGVTPPNPFQITSQAHVNNVMIKKVKIALTMTSEDIQECLRLAGLYVSPSEIGAILRKAGQRNYMPCKDSFARNFLKGLTIRERKIDTTDA